MLIIMDINLTTPTKDFYTFLKKEDNSRIFFSAKFGMGKTYFLKSFFNQYEKEYDVYHLFPARYQITSADNIIDFLRHDLLTELGVKYPDDIDKKTPAGQRIKANLKDFRTSKSILLQLFLQLGRVGKGAEAIDTIASLLLADETDQQIEEVKNKQVNRESLDDFLKNQIRENKNNKKSVLIIDDLDRLDPEHIFKILNICSSILDNENPQLNKFDFDTVIIVGDHDNIQKIFHHKYGPETDFKGYFDKFFTNYVYEFNNIEAVEEFMIPQIKSMAKKKYNIDMITDNGFSSVFTVILQQSVKSNTMNLRVIFNQILNFDFPVFDKYYNHVSFINQRILHRLDNMSQRQKNMCGALFLLLEALNSLYPDKNTLIKDLKTMAGNSFSNDVLSNKGIDIQSLEADIREFNKICSKINNSKSTVIDYAKDIYDESMSYEGSIKSIFEAIIEYIEFRSKNKINL